MERSENIVVLDSQFIASRKQYLSELEAFGNAELYFSCTKENIHERVLEATILLNNRTPINRETIEVAKNLRYIGAMSTGYNSIDTDYAREKNIIVTNIPNYSTESVSQLVFSFILERASRLTDFTQFVNRGDWSNNASPYALMNKMLELQGKTLGIYGFGEIGKAVGRLGKAFGMNIIYSSRTKKSDIGYDAEFVGFKELLARSDFLSLNAAVGESNKYIFDKLAFRQMKPTAFLINAARGFLIESSDLAEALNSETIAGACLDVTAPNEPPHKDNPLLTAKNCIITPHIAWGPVETRRRLEKIALDNVRQFLDGHPVNVVN